MIRTNPRNSRRISAQLPIFCAAMAHLRRTDALAKARSEGDRAIRGVYVSEARVAHHRYLRALRGIVA